MESELSKNTYSVTGALTSIAFPATSIEIQFKMGFVSSVKQAISYKICQQYSYYGDISTK